MAFFITNSHKKTILFTDNSPYLNQIVFDDTDTTVLRYDLTEQAPEYKFGLGNAKVRPTVDYKGNYWMTSLNGLLKVEIEATLEQKKLVYKYYSPSDFQGAPNERVLAVQSDSKGNIFVSTQHSAKFFVKEWNSDVFKPITVPDSLMKKDGWGVSKQPIESITLQKNGKLLICFLYHHYCYEYTYSTNTWTRLLEFPMEFKPQYAKEKNEATNIMGPVTFDYENDLLYFHTDQGMLIYDPKASSVESETEGLVPNVYITSIVPNPVYTDGFTANLRCFPDGANNVSAKLYNSLGIELRDFTPNMHIDDLGYCTVNCDTRNLPTGLYIFSLKKGNETTSKNVIILNGK